MRELTRSDLQTLIEQRGDPAVTITMPTHRGSDLIQQDPIRLKNLLDAAERKLKEWGLRSPEARALLEPMRELILREDFWQTSSDGLALFRTADVFYLYQLPLSFEEEVSVSDRFHLKHLIPLLSGDGRFYILALSQKEVRLLRATRAGAEVVELENVPTSLEEALAATERMRTLQWHTSTMTPSGQRRPAVFHGHGGEEADRKDDIRLYLERVDRGLGEILAGDDAPVVLAAVDYIMAMYRDVSSYRNLAPEGVVGSPEELSPKELHERAWKIVAPRFQDARREAEERFRKLYGDGSALASADVAETVRAAFAERVDTLFVAVGQHRWGRFDPSDFSVEQHDEEQLGDDDLLDLAAEQTFLNSGTVYAVEQSEVPGGGVVAAIFRY